MRPDAFLRAPASDSSSPADPLGLVKLTALMKRASGIPEVKVGLIDGPVDTHHPALAREHLRELPGHGAASCTRLDSVACMHGTFVAGILFAKRGSFAPAICPNCTLLVRPIFAEPTSKGQRVPNATAAELAAAIAACIDAGARVINLSLGFAAVAMEGQPALEETLSRAVERGVLVVAAAGNQGTVGSSAISRHPWVISVAACDRRGRPMKESNLGNSIGRRGVSAPGEGIASLGPRNQSMQLEGTSVATPFVTGAIALLWSEFPSATASQIRLAVVGQGTAPSRASVVPRLLDAAAAHRALAGAGRRGPGA